MPQASENLRREWGGYDGIGEDKAENFLKSKGYILTDSWLWILPTPDHELTKDEIGAISFLIDEWDYGGWVKDDEEAKKFSINRRIISSSEMEIW